MSAGDKPVIFVIDDDRSVRDALDSLLRAVGFDVWTFASPDEFLRADRTAREACLVLDVQMPGISGVEFQQQLAEAGSGLPVIFITAHGDIPMSVRAMKAGALEFLTKPFDDQQLLDAIAEALATDRQRREALAAGEALHRRFATLTSREKEVMALVVKGRLNKQIAGDLGLSEATVKLHRGHVMRKMLARSVAQLVVMATALPAGRTRQNVG